MKSREELIKQAVRQLESAGVPDPASDAHALLMSITEATDLTRAAEARYEQLIRRRSAREPLGRLIGVVTLRGVAFTIGPGVFLPQPETGAVIEWVVDEVRRRGWNAPVIADLCSGAGTLALCLAHEVPQARVYAIERDAVAYRWGRRNAETQALLGDPPVDIRLGDAAGAFSDLDGVVDIVVSNPPYVAEHEADIRDPEVVRHDPGAAVWAGPDGLDVVRIIERAARRLLRPDGLVTIEHSDRQGRSAPNLLAATGAWYDITDHRDHEGHDRFVSATRRPHLPRSR